MSAEQRNFSRGDEVRSKKRKIEEIAPFENDAQFLWSLKKLLETNIQDIGVEKSEEPYEESTHIQWALLECASCKKTFMEAKELLEHVLKCRFTQKEESLYNKYGLVTLDVDKVITEAQEKRASKSYITKSCASSMNVRFVVPVTSPLAPYISRGISIYLNKIPSDLRRVITCEIQIGTNMHILYFSTKFAENQIEEVLAIKEEHAKRRAERAYRRAMMKPNNLGIPQNTRPITARTKRVRITEEVLDEEEDDIHSEGGAEPILEIEDKKENVNEEETAQDIIWKKEPKIETDEPHLPTSRRRRPKLENQRLASSFTTDFLALESSKRVPKQKKPLDF